MPRTYTRNLPLVTMLLAATSFGAIAQDTNAVEGEFTLEEIIVTAERRSENLQDIAASISAVTGARLEKLGIRDIRDLQNFIPGLTVKGQSIGSVKLNIRGVGQAQDDITVESGVGVFIDDIYIPRQGAASGALYDLERVEVLRGPQGTLYGRNTAGGSINFISKRPGEKLEGKFSAEYGNRNTYNVGGYLSGPVIEDKLFVKASVLTQQADGYVTNTVTGNKGNGADTYAGRFGLRYIVDEDLEFYMTLDGEKSNPEAKLFNIGPDGGYQSFVHALFNNIVGFDIFPGEPATNFYETAVDNDGFEQLETWGLMARVDSNHENFNASYIFGYRESELNTDADRDLSPVSLLNERHDEDTSWGSVEARFSSNPEGNWSMDGDLEWTVGLYYFWEDGTRQVDFYNFDTIAIATQGAFDGEAILRFDQSIETEAFAVFGQTTYSITDTTRFTFGGRWTTEQKTAGIATDVIDPLGGAVFGPPNNGGIIDEIYDSSTTRRFNDVTLKLGLEQDLTEDVLFYATYSEGFKSGGFNGTSPTAAVAATGFEPEDVKSYEAGIKGSFHDRLNVNFSAFKIDYTNLQAAIVSNGGAPFIVNADADIQGAELEVVGIPTEHLLLNFTLGYIDSEYTRFDGSPENVGTQVNGVPDWKTSIGVDYSIPVSGGGEITLHGDYSWEAATTEISPAGSQTPLLQPFDVLNFRASYRPENEKWEIAASVRNATDNEYWLSTGSAAAPGSPIGAQARLPAPPVSYLLSFTYFLN